MTALNVFISVIAAAPIVIRTLDVRDTCSDSDDPGVCCKWLEPSSNLSVGLFTLFIPPSCH
jgi:hypothetical protein